MSEQSETDMSPVNFTFGLDAIFRPIGTGLSYAFGAMFPNVKEKKLINDARIEARVEAAKHEEEENIRKARELGISVVQYLADPYGCRGTIQLAQFLKTVDEDKIRQEAKTEAAKAFIEQLHVELSLAFQSGNYEAVISVSNLLKAQLSTSSIHYNYVKNICIFSISMLITSEHISKDKKFEYYKELSKYIHDVHDINDFDAIFAYGLANLHMLTVVPISEGLNYIETAKECFVKTLSLDRDKTLSLINLAITLNCLERHANVLEERIEILQKAVSYLEQAKEIEPQNYKIFSNLGEIYIRLAEISLAHYEQQHEFLKLAIQNFSDGLSVSWSFSLISNKATALFALGKIEQNDKEQEEIFQATAATYNDAYIIAPRRIDAAIVCLKIAYVLSLRKNNASLSQDKRDNIIFEGLRCYMTALEYAPFYAELQYETATLIFNIAKFGEQDIPSFKNIMQQQVQVVVQPGQRQIAGQARQAQKQARQAADQAMLLAKTKILEFAYRYFWDAVYLMPENPQVVAAFGESCVYWAFLQKRQGRQINADKALNSAAQRLEQADQLKPYSASYVRACLHAVQGDVKGCQDRLKDAVQHGICPPRGHVAREPYFSEYSKAQWFKEVLETIPERPLADLYSTALFSDVGQNPLLDTPGGTQ